MSRYVVIGGGILGLATARAITQDDPSAQVTVLEKEAGLAEHQTGRNSGVIHSGIYYLPGSAKARMCQAGGASMAAYAESRGIPVIRTGKLIVATSVEELPRLAALEQRGIDNGVPVQRISPEQAREYEPFVSCIAALRVSSTAITDYRAVCAALAADLAGLPGDRAEVRTGVTVTGLSRTGGHTVLATSAGDLHADVVINCAGLQSDRIAALDVSAGGSDGSDGADGADCRIVPFRGEYFELVPERSYLVKGLIYPVPDPSFPFLGVHLTRMVDGSVHAGPNAVLALAREGYRWRTVRPRDVLSTLGFGGFWALARANYRPGFAEMARSLSRTRFAASLARLVPDITEDDLVPAKAGVRAQALRADGSLVDDFLIVRRGANVHVLNAPSPAATSALEIGRHVSGLATGAVGRSAVDEGS